MGKVAIKLKITPKEVGIDMRKFGEEVANVLKNYGSIYRISIEPVAFGLEVIKVTLIKDGEEGLNEDKLKEDLSKVENFENVEVEEVTLITGL